MEGSGVQDPLRDLLDEAARSSHHGKPGLPATRKRWWAAELAGCLSAGEAVERIAEWAGHPDPVVRQVALLLMTHTPEGPRLVEQWALGLASDADWEVREWVVAPLAYWMDRDPAWGESTLLQWLEAGAGPRRAAIVAVRQGLLRAPSQRLSCAFAVGVADRMVDDPDPYVRANTGSYLLGDGLYRVCPEATLRWLAQRVSSGRVTEAFLANLLRLAKSRDGRAGSEPLRPIVRQALTHREGPAVTGLRRWLENVTRAGLTRDNQEESEGF